LLLLLLVCSSYLRSTPNGIKFMYLTFCLTVQSHLHQIQYVHMAHGFPPPFCTGKYNLIYITKFIYVVLYRLLRKYFQHKRKIYAVGK
jgi:hypothetical protein